MGNQVNQLRNRSADHRSDDSDTSFAIDNDDDNVNTHAINGKLTLESQSQSQPLPIKQNCKIINNKSDFVIDHDNINCIRWRNDINEQYSSNRTVFVNLDGLYQSWKSVPFYVLYNSICILPIQPQWISTSTSAVTKLNTSLRSAQLPPMQRNKFDNNYNHFMFTDSEFVIFLRFKQEQKLLFCLENEMESGLDFWSNLSKKLTEITDPSSSAAGCNRKLQCYKPLVLDVDYWRNKKCEKMSVSFAEIFNELVHLQFESCHAIKCILEESNPSLHVLHFTYVCSYAHASNHNNNTKMNNDTALDEDWWVSDEYFG